ncbi:MULTISPECIES: DUF3105 domain-containing protein [unclassified Nocardioides]|uniref:DUF3105 domain-containing protein n=1 Tax=unclassified Nocardioides TaxID=2615069 RepID=UPI0006F7D6E9|nr:MULTISPECIES: DUF3105 domain-containing protein [unclassified Nocardioides]KQY56481.1 hypothetical protein ASD30_09060 [Nocardioides sp. Root140]KQZ75236.1 hypothetical protein ASD66_02365 [Nocardioides sp. Root151]KRF14315.1 hypothetical protein ASH02_08160 [Nocardioides sp. Soil796]
MANSKKVSRREVADQLRNQQKRADKRQGLVIVGVCVLIAVVIIGLAAYRPIKNWWDLREFKNVDISGIGAPASSCQDIITKKATGEQEHVPAGTDIDYKDAPPAFGKHEEVPDTPDRKLYTKDDRPRVEMLVHNLEHGYTIIWYDETIADDDEQMTELQAIARKLKGTNNQRLKFKAVPWLKSDGKAFPDGTHVSITHWSKGGADADGSKQVGVWQYCPKVSGEALYDFMTEYDYFDSPEPNGM